MLPSQIIVQAPGANAQDSLDSKSTVDVPSSELLQKPESEENQSQFQIIAHRLDHTKRKGAYYYLFKGGSSSLNFATLFADVLKETLSWYFLPFLAFGSIYRAYLNIQESELISSINLNLWSKIIFNGALAIVAILGCIAIAVPMLFGYASVVPFISCIAYAGKFITKIGLTGLYLRRYLNSEPGTERRGEGIGRAKKYALSAAVSFMALCIGVALGVLHIATGSISTYCLLGAAFAIGAFNSAYVVKLEFMEKESTLPEEIEHVDLIENKETKKTFLIKLMDKKIKSLTSSITYLEQLKDRKEGRKYEICSMSEMHTETTEDGKTSEKPEKFKLYLECLNGQLLYRTDLMKRKMALTPENCLAVGIKQERVNLLFELLKSRDNHNFMSDIAEYKDDILKATEHKAHTYPAPSTPSRAWNYIKYTVMNFFPRHEKEKKALLEEMKKSLESPKDKVASANNSSMLGVEAQKQRKTISDIAADLDKDQNKKSQVFSYSYFFGKQSETELFMKTAQKIETESKISSVEPETNVTSYAEVAIALPLTTSNDSMSTMTGDSVRSSSKSAETPSQRDSELASINSLASTDSSKGFEYDEKIIDSLKKIEDKEVRKQFLKTLIDKKIQALDEEIRKKKSKKRENKKVFLNWLKVWLNNPSELLAFKTKEGEQESDQIGVGKLSVWTDQNTEPTQIDKNTINFKRNNGEITFFWQKLKTIEKRTFKETDIPDITKVLGLSFTDSLTTQKLFEKITSKCECSNLLNPMGELMDFLDKHPEFSEDVFSSYRSMGDTELLLKATAIHLDMGKPEVADIHAPGHKEGKFYFRDITNTLKAIKDDKKRQNCLISLLEKKIKSIHEHVIKANGWIESEKKYGEPTKIVFDTRKHLDKMHMLKWLKTWLEQDAEPTIFTLPDYYKSTSGDSIVSNKICDMNDLTDFLEFTGKYKPVNQPVFKNLTNFVLGSPQKKFRDNVYSSLLESLGEVDGLIRAVTVHLDLRNENRAKDSAKNMTVQKTTAKPTETKGHTSTKEDITGAPKALDEGAGLTGGATPIAC